MYCKFFSRGLSRRNQAFLLAALALLALALVPGGCGDENDASDESGNQAAAETANTVTTNELTQEWLATRAANKIGGAHLVRDITITENGADKQVKIEVDRPELCHDGAVVGTVAVFAQNMMGILYKNYPEVSDVEIIMYGPEQGFVSDEVAMQVDMSRDSAQGVDWFAFDEKNIFQLVTSYYMHPKIEASYQLEGALPYDQQTQ